MNKKIKVLSLFDGISCARVALERAGFEVDTYHASEIDEYAMKISQKNYPDIIQMGDIKDVKFIGGSASFCDLLIGGSPCQDLSVAKRSREGLSGARSGLFYEFVRILKETKPKYFILENVNSMHKEAKQIITDILGVQPIMINAELVSAQSRKRLFWTNIPNIIQPKDKKLFLKDIIEPKGIDITERMNAKKEGTLAFKKAWRVNLRTLNQKSKTLMASGQNISNCGATNIDMGDGTYRKLTPIECERLQCLPDNYTAKEKMSVGQRYKMLGNAFNVDVVAHILSFIPKVEEENNQIIQGNSLGVLKTLPDESVDCVITSPPYWALRDYDHPEQLGAEKDFNEYISKLCDIFDEIKRVLKTEGTCFVNMGDTYGGSGDKGSWTDPKNKSGRNGQKIALNKGMPKKSLCQIPSRFAIEMTNRGWLLRNEIIWQKPNAMPSSVKDRFSVDFEKVFFFTKHQNYFFEQQLEESKNREDNEYRIELRKSKDYENKKPYQGNFPKSFLIGKRNKRAVWSVATKPYTGAHFAVFPEKLIIPMIEAGCPHWGIVLDPFFGAGTTGVVAKKLGRKWMGIELNPAYIELARKRIDEIVIQDKLFD